MTKDDNNLVKALSMIPISVCFGGAIFMALNGIGGWGWFLFVGVISITAVFD